jgi:hypothetical protein
MRMIYEVIREVRKWNRTLPFIIPFGAIPMSAKQEITALDAGADEFRSTSLFAYRRNSCSRSGGASRRSAL